MIFYCYICKSEFYSLKKVLNHLKSKELIKENCKIKLKCIVSDQCFNTFNSFSGLIKHIKSHEKVMIPEVNITSNIILNETENDEQIIQIYQSPCSSNTIDTKLNTNFEKNMKDLYNVMNNSGLPEDTITNVFLGVKNITKSVVEMISSQNTESKKRKIDEVYDTLGNFTSKYKRQQYFSKTINFVEPKSVAIGFRWEQRIQKKTSIYKRQLVQNFFQFIPITQTITSVFKNNYYRELFINFNESHCCEPDTYKYSCCGKYFQSIKHNFNNCTKILIQLYYDDFEVCRVLGSKTIIHKIGAIYFSILNFPQYLRSSLQNIFLVSLFYVNDLHGNFNINSVLDPIVKDLILLENGFILDDIGFVKGCLFSLSHDNLAANELIGFTKSFSAKYFCRFCVMPNEETKHCIHEKLNILRSYDCYNIINEKSPYEKINLQDTFGVYRNSSLNKLTFFHTMQFNA